MELSRLLRRVLLVAAVAAAGWLLSAVFAGTASADELPGDGTQTQRQQSGGLLGGLIGGLGEALTGATDTVSGITGSLLDPADDFLPPIADPPAPPQESEPPSILPGDSSSGGATTERDDAVSRADAPVVVPVASPVVAAAPAPAAVAPAAPAPVARRVVAVPSAPATPTVQDSAATEHAGEGDPRPRPVKAPAGPAGSGTAVSVAHDHPGGARGTHGVLPAQATLHPADAGFTTRSRATGAAGRAAGLPASSPD